MKLSNNLIPIVLVSATLYGCQSGLYKVSTSEDGKKLDESVRYYDIGSGTDFIKDNGASPDGILYDEEQMPIKIIEGRSDKKFNRSDWSILLNIFSLGLFPAFDGEYITKAITVKSPIGEKAGSYRVDAKRWVGWFPLFIGYPDFADERDDYAKLPNPRLESIGEHQLIKNLVGAFSYNEYVTYAKSKNGERKAEIDRVRSVSEKVTELLVKNKFDDAETLIAKESMPRSATQECDVKLWADMRERVVVARQAYEKNHVQALIVAGKYEDAITFCNSTNSLSDEVKGELKRKAETAHIRSVSEKVSGLLVKNQFDEASTLIENESKLWVDMRKHAILVHQTGVSEKEDRHHAGKTFDDIAALFNALTENESTPRSVMEIKKVTTPRLAIQEYDEKPWADMRERVVVARQAYEKNHVQALIAAGKYGDAISYCNSKNSLSDETNSELKREAEAARIISVFGEVSELLSKNKFDDAETLIDNESKSYLSTQASDEKSWADMRERVVVARQAYDRNHVQTLIAADKYEDAISFCNSKNSLSKEANDELKRKAVLGKVTELIAKNKFDDAATLIDSESKSCSSTQTGDENSWADLRERVIVARRAYEKNHVETLVAAGKYDDAISFCNSRNLISDEVVMKLKSLNLLSRLTKEQLVKIANTTERDDVALSVIGLIDDKIDLCSLLDKKSSVDVFKTILEKIADADLVRTEIWEIRPKIGDDGNEDELCAYASVFGSDDECLRLIKSYPELLTGKVMYELKAKVTKEETRNVIEEFQMSRVVHDVSKLEGTNLIERIYRIQDEDVRQKVALGVINKMRVNSKMPCPWSLFYYRDAVECLNSHGEDRASKYERLGDYQRTAFVCLALLKVISKADIEAMLASIKSAATERINFEGFYIGMSFIEYILLSVHHGCVPEFERKLLVIDRMTFNRTLRYKLFEKEDGEFWSAFMRKYIPARKKKSLGDAIGDALDSGTYDYQMGYDDRLEEPCYIYKSMKYGTKVIFGTDSGTLVLEEYK